MKRSTKAILASTLLFPGSGQYLLKRPFRALCIASVAAIVTLVFFVQIVIFTQAIVDEVVRGGIPADFLLIRKMIAEQQSESGVASLAFSLLVIIWIVGIIDTLLLARQPLEEK